MYAIPRETSNLTPIETAFAGTSKGNPACWAPLSKLVGPAWKTHLGSGQGFGTVADSRFCNTRDASVSCMTDTHVHSLAYGTGKAPAQNALFSFVDDKSVRPALAGAAPSHAAPVAPSGGAQRSYGSYSSCPSCGGAGYLTYNQGGPCGCSQIITDRGYPVGTDMFLGSKVDAFGWSPESATVFEGQGQGNDAASCQTCSGTPQFREASNYIGNRYSCEAAKYPCLPGQQCPA